jgi:hypothetical protein
MSKKLQDKKKKQREERAKERVLARRAAIQKHRKEETRRQLFEKKFSQKVLPILNDPEQVAAREERIKNRVLEKLKHNEEILQALEDQYNEEQKVRSEINAELESEGHTKFKDKMDALEKKILNNDLKAETPLSFIAKNVGKKKKKKFSFGGAADVEFSAKKSEEDDAN